MMVLWWLRGSRGAGRSKSEPQAILLVLWVVAHGGSSGMVKLGSLHGRWFGHRAWRRSRARVRLRFLTSPTSTANLLNCFPYPPPSLLPNSLLTPIPPFCMPYAGATAPFTACCCCGILPSHRNQPPQSIARENKSQRFIHHHPLLKTEKHERKKWTQDSSTPTTQLVTENKWPKKKMMMVMKFFGRCTGREGTKHKPRILGMCCRFTVRGWKKGKSKNARARSLNEWIKSEKQARELLLRLYF